MLKKYVESSENKSLLTKYCLKKLRVEFDKTTLQALTGLIELHLESVIDKIFEKRSYDKWQITAENVGEMNTIIFEGIRDSVRNAFAGRDVDPLKAIDEMLDAKARGDEKETRESNTLERAPIEF